MFLYLTYPVSFVEYDDSSVMPAWVWLTIKVAGSDAHWFINRSPVRLMVYNSPGSYRVHLIAPYMVLYYDLRNSHIYNVL